MTGTLGLCRGPAHPPHPGPPARAPGWIPGTEGPWLLWDSGLYVCDHAGLLGKDAQRLPARLCLGLEAAMAQATRPSPHGWHQPMPCPCSLSSSFGQSLDAAGLT